jgi:hypothetical protein
MGEEMTYKRTVPTVYFVALPGGAVKVGMSMVQRWRNFVARGAEVIALCELPDTPRGVLDGYELESHLHALLRCRMEPAFTSGEEAKAALGNGGSGWKECYRTDGKNGRAISQPYSAPVTSLMARYGTVRNGTVRHQDPGKNSFVPDAAGAVDNPETENR